MIIQKKVVTDLEEKKMLPLIQIGVSGKITLNQKPRDPVWNPASTMIQ